MYGQIHKLDCICENDYSNSWVCADSTIGSRKLQKYTMQL